MVGWVWMEASLDAEVAVSGTWGSVGAGIGGS